MNIFWHQRDPRTVDNAGLASAAREDVVLPVYVIDSDLLGSIGDRQRTLLFRGVRKLQHRYRELGSDLLVRSGSPSDVLPAIATEYDAEALYYNEQYRAAHRNRQRRVDDALAGAGIETESKTDLVLVSPNRLDSSYPNHSQFYDDWTEQPKLSPFEEPTEAKLVEIDFDQTVPVPDVDIDLPQAGYEAARERFEQFCTEGIYTYNETRDDLARAVEAPTRAVSRLSPYLATGQIGIRELWERATEIYRSVQGSEQRNVDKYRYELSWREQNYHLLYHNPDLPVENYKQFPNPIEWREDEADFAAWKAGETGYPLVDAGMRQLNQEGYIHNRPRQVVASFLTKHLLIDWRAGAQYFTKQLLDHDYASNYGNWQWIASTGTDSVDVRIFDPVSQMSKYDAAATFVTEYVPELGDVSAGKIVDWPTLSTAERTDLAPEYPDPIVDRNEGYERAQRTFERALGKR